jgi:hypothetical protein
VRWFAAEEVPPLKEGWTVKKVLDLGATDVLLISMVVRVGLAMTNID